MTHDLSALAKKIRDGYIEYGDALKQGQFVLPPDEKDIKEEIQKWALSVVPSKQEEHRRNPINDILETYKKGYNKAIDEIRERIKK